MQISARSYLTAGVSLTAASAIALTPLAVPVNEKAIAIPNVTISDIQLTVTPAEIVAFFDNLQDELAEFNAGLAAVVALPGDTLVDGLALAIAFNADFFDTLSGLTTNPALLGLLDELYISSEYSLSLLLDAVGYSNETIFETTEGLANLLTSTITGSLSNVLSSFVAVLNNPLEVSNYTSLVSNGLVRTIQEMASNGISAVDLIGTAGFVFADEGLYLAQWQIWNALDTVSQLANVTAAATGSDLIVAVNDAIQSITIAPAMAINSVAFGVATDVLYGFWDGFDQIIGGSQAITNIIGFSLRNAINTIGAAPLDPEAYLQAGGAVLAGGFYSFDTAVVTASNVAQIPFNVGIGITTTVAQNLALLTTGFAEALSDILYAVGLPADIADLPLAVAAQITEIIAAGAGAIAGGLSIGADLIEAGTGVILDVSNSIAGAIGIPPFVPPVTPPPVEEEDDDVPDNEFAARSVAVVEETEEAPVEETPVEEAPAEEAPSEEAPADDTTGSDDEAAEDADNEKVSKREARAAEREAKKADREAAKESTKADRKAERESKKAEKAADKGSDSSSDSSGSDSE